MRQILMRVILLSALAIALLLNTGCIGIYDNTDLFLNDPAVGSSEVDMLKMYGTPAFATTAEDKKVYTYKVRDVLYIICVGIYKGHDMVVVLRDGDVEEVKKVARPSTFTLFQPLPWAVAD